MEAVNNQELELISKRVLVNFKQFTGRVFPCPPTHGEHELWRSPLPPDLDAGSVLVWLAVCPAGGRSSLATFHINNNIWHFSTTSSQGERRTSASPPVLRWRVVSLLTTSIYLLLLFFYPVFLLFSPSLPLSSFLYLSPISL